MLTYAACFPNNPSSWGGTLSSYFCECLTIKAMQAWVPMRASRHLHRPCSPRQPPRPPTSRPYAAGRPRRWGRGAWSWYTCIQSATSAGTARGTTLPPWLLLGSTRYPPPPPSPEMFEFNDGMNLPEVKSMTKFKTAGRNAGVRYDVTFSFSTLDKCTCRQLYHAKLTYEMSLLSNASQNHSPQNSERI